MHLDNMTTLSVIDVSGTLARLGGDQQLFLEMLRFLLEDAPPLMSDLHRAADVSDATVVRSRAHALKGLVAGCGGVRAAKAAQRIENVAEEGDLGDVASLLEKLEVELELLTQAALDIRLTRIVTACQWITLPPARLRLAPACRSRRRVPALCSAGSRA